MAVIVEEMVRGKRELRLWRGQKKVKSSSGHDQNDKSRPCSSNEKEKSGEKLVTGGSRQHLLDAIAKGGGNHEVTTYIGEDGKVRMKILVKKQDLKQILAAASAAEATVVNTVKTPVVSSTTNNADNSVEKRLHDLMMSRKIRSFRRRKLNHNTHFGAWTPALYSIPEEHCAC